MNPPKFASGSVGPLMIEEKLTLAMSPSHIGKADSLPQSQAAAQMGSERPGLLVPLQPGGHRTPIFLAPGSGGGLHWLHPLARQFAPHRPVYGLASQALSSQARQAFTIEAAAREFVQALRTIQPSGPYLLGGYSMGGLIALEMGRIFIRDGERVGPLLMLDCYGPPEFSTALGKCRAVARYFAGLEFQQKKGFITERIGLIQSRLAWRLGSQPQKAEAGVLQQEDLAAVKYVADVLPFDGEVLLMFASQRLATAPVHELGGWRSLFTGQVHTRTFPGTHYQLVGAHNAPAVAEAIRSILPKDANSD